MSIPQHWQDTRPAEDVLRNIHQAELNDLVDWAESVRLYEGPMLQDGFLPEAPPTLKQRIGGWLVRLGMRWAL